MIHINTAPSIERVYARLTENLDTDESLETFALRFRPNLVSNPSPSTTKETAGAGAGPPPALLPFDEFDWCGRRLRLGDDVIIRVNEPTIRCPSVRPRYDDPSASVDEIRPERLRARGVPVAFRARVFDREPTTLRERGSYFGVYASVLTDGIVRDGDLVRILDEY